MVVHWRAGLGQLLANTHLTTTGTDCFHRLQAQSYLHITYSDGSICDFHHAKLNGDGSVAAVCDCRGLTSHIHRYFYQYKYVFEVLGSISKSGLLVHDSHRLKAQSYLHATCSGGSICVSGLSVQEDTDCSTELLILVEVSVKVACRSTTATD